MMYETPELDPDAYLRSSAIRIHDAEGFEGMRRAGRLVAEALDMITPFVQPGVTTGEIDDRMREFTLDHGALPACLGYKGYTKTVCTSINHVVCHGIPGDKVLKAGDIVNIDHTVIVDGWHGDSSRMYPVGEINARARKLIDVTYEGIELGLAQVRPGNTFGDIEGAVIQEGMFFTIEPMVNLGKPAVKVLSDGWTAVTRDKSLSAQCEHTIGVTETGLEIFSASPTGIFRPKFD